MLKDSIGSKYGIYPCWKHYICFRNIVYLQNKIVITQQNKIVFARTNKIVIARLKRKVNIQIAEIWQHFKRNWRTH